MDTHFYEFVRQIFANCIHYSYISTRLFSTTHHRQTALHWTATEGKDDLVELLIDAGADVEKVDSLGCTPSKFEQFIEC